MARRQDSAASEVQVWDGLVGEETFLHGQSEKWLKFMPDG